jgi:hypothetical protein
VRESGASGEWAAGLHGLRRRAIAVWKCGRNANRKPQTANRKPQTVDLRIANRDLRIANRSPQTANAERRTPNAQRKRVRHSAAAVV